MDDKRNEQVEVDDFTNTNNGGSRTLWNQMISGTFATFLLKILSFGCTQWTFRALDDDVAALGRAAIKLDLLYVTILFISREGFRLSMTRNIKSSNWNVAWLSIPTTTIATTLALSWHLNQSEAMDRDSLFAGILYCLAAWVEGLAEPAVLFCLRSMNVTKKVKAEGFATFIKTITTVLALKQLLPEWPVLAFGIAQIAHSIFYSAYLLVTTRLPFPRWGDFDVDTCYMTGVFTLQAFFKHLLTEGDRILLTALSGSYDQGIYAMGLAYGGLAARLILQPLEENARLLWSRLQSESDSNNNKFENLNLMELSYGILVKIVLYVGFTFSCLATNYCSILLNILAGKKWAENSEATAVLSAFCVYTAFLAWNGMTEAFLYGVTQTGGEIAQLGVAHTIVGGVFAGISATLVPKYGTVSLVFANCLAMFMRSLYSVHYAVQHFSARKKQSFNSTLRRLIIQMFPHWAVIGSFVGSALLTRASLAWFDRQVVDVKSGSREWFVLAFYHVATGVGCFILITVVAFLTEWKDFRHSIKMLMQQKQD